MANTALWNKKQLGYNNKRHIRHFPTEYLLRAILSNSYFEHKTPIDEGMNVLDIGCLYANNLVPFSDRGAEVYGIEVCSDGVEIAKESSAAQGLNAHIELGTNRSIPFPDNHFDFVLSINTIHYEENKESVRSALKEMRRVLKKDGCLLISSGGQEHKNVREAHKNGPNDYIVQKMDFRDGERFSFFDSLQDFFDTLDNCFGRVEVANITEEYPKTTLQFYIGKCIK